MGESKRTGRLRGAWLLRLEPNLNKRGQFAPAMQRQWLSILFAIAFALLFEWVLFGLLAKDWTWPWVQVRELNGASDSLVQPAIALLTPIIALVSAVFSYRKSTLALAESQRADVAAFQQRFIDGAKLLADINASTRIAGATAMGSLARDWVENRQECVNVLCGYLRVKPVKTVLTETITQGRQVFTWEEGEDVVRREVVSQLRRILTTGSEVRPGLAPLRLDLQGAWLPPDCDFGEARFDGQACFDLAHFTGSARFNNAEFTDLVTFQGARFAGDAWFERARFYSAAVFSDVEISGDAVFSDAAFATASQFTNTTFSVSPRFEGAIFYYQRAEHDSFGRPAHELGPLTAQSGLPMDFGHLVDELGTTQPAKWFIATPERPSN